MNCKECCYYIERIQRSTKEKLRPECLLLGVMEQEQQQECPIKQYYDSKHNTVYM